MDAPITSFERVQSFHARLFEIARLARGDCEAVLKRGSGDRIDQVSHQSMGALMSSIVSVRSAGWNQPLTGQASSSFISPLLKGCRPAARASVINRISYLGFRAEALHPRLYAGARIRELRVSNDNRATTNATDKPSHNPIGNRRGLSQDKFTRAPEGGRIGKTERIHTAEHINSKAASFTIDQALEKMTAVGTAGAR